MTLDRRRSARSSRTPAACSSCPRQTEGVPRRGDIVHLLDARFLPAGGGGLASTQLCRSDAEIHLFTAVGHDAAARAVEERIRVAPGRLVRRAKACPARGRRWLGLGGRDEQVAPRGESAPAAGDSLR
ncbi:hypothetical protein WMF37_19400 [Sorangium sp. So ce291]|uniref:hypothetical protein n=1 Tax=Sorangium sp. So ce291 TaxID=3133294 RepID=UPI003F5ECDBB